MAIQGPIPLEFGVAFPDGVYAAGAFEPVRDFDRSQGDRFVQQLDKATGQPLWAVEVIDADPQARARTVKIKVISARQPTGEEAALLHVSPDMPVLNVIVTVYDAAVQPLQVMDLVLPGDRHEIHDAYPFT